MACAFHAALLDGAARQRPWHNALIAERAALFMLAHGMGFAGRQMLIEAHRRYAAWGATAKLRRLEQAHPLLKRQDLTPRKANGAARPDASADVIDMLGVARASQALSSETSLERLRLRVIELLAGMTGATTVQIALWHDDSRQWLLPQAMQDGVESSLTVAEAGARGLLPLSAFRYAERTREPLLVDDATRDDRFARDPYFAGQKQCSLLLVPIDSQGVRRAILLLENRLSARTFSAERLQAVTLIAGQLAVSLDNALLYERLEQRVRERTDELQQAQAQLLGAARLAGMAEIATNVLHNVGNVLNSVNVSAGLIGTRLRASKLGGLARAVQLIDAHPDDLGDFLTRDSRGKLLPGYLRELAAALQGEQAAIGAELDALGKSLDHIKEVVATQQSYAGTPRMVEFLRLDELLDDALRMNAGALTRHKVEVVKQLAELPALPLDRHRLLQILVNLIGNAKQALEGMTGRDACITLGTCLADTAAGRALRITIADNGEGIAPEHLSRLFAHGFTTRCNGHGFGLHSCVLAAQEMGGSLSAHSAGRGQGASFTLEIPVEPTPGAG